jgi:hypothetical protein
MLTRIPSIAFLAALCLYGFFSPFRTRVASPFFLAGVATFLLLAVKWIAFAAGFSEFESPHGLNPVWRWPALLADYLQLLPAAAGWGLTASAALAVAAAVWMRRAREMLLPVSWAFTAMGLLLATREHYEARYLVYVLIALPLVVAIGLKLLASGRILHRVLTALAGLSIGMSAVALGNIDAGLLGTRQAATYLGSLERSGNILLVTPFDTDIMFHYRAGPKLHERQFIRGDRTLVVRLPDYAKAQQKITGKRIASIEEFLGLLRAGRVRYFATCLDDRGRTCQREEELVAHQLANRASGPFRRLAEFPVRVESNLSCSLFLWEFLEEPAPGRSELPVVIPTASMVLDSLGEY